MATTPAHPPVPSAPVPPPDAHFDELTGVYGFFRRHQKKILYSAGLFTLLTFSITGSMQAFVSGAFTTPPPLPSILVNGSRVMLTQEDYRIGNELAKKHGIAIPFNVLPPLGESDDAAADRGEILAILRCAARHEGLEGSRREADRAIETLREMFKSESAAKFAGMVGFHSLAEYRAMMTEAMRIGLYVKLQTLGVDASDAKVLHVLMSDRERITLRVAQFDEKQAEAALKAAGTLTDADLQKWLDGKQEFEKDRIGIYDLPRAELRFAGLLLAADQFDPEQWKEEVLKDYAVGDDQLKSLYEAEKDIRFKLEGDKNWKPFEDAAVKAELTRLSQAEQVMNQLLGKLRTKLDETLKPLNVELGRAQTEAAEGEGAREQLVADQGGRQSELEQREKELAGKPDDAALKDTVEQLRKAVAKAKEDLFAMDAALPSKKAAVTAAQDALNAARSAFDLGAEFAALTKDKKGVVQKAMSGNKNAEELKDLDKVGVELGTWSNAKDGTNLGNPGDLGFSVGRTSKAVVVYQATKLERKPLKTQEQIKPLAEGAYWTEQAKKQGDEKRKLMTDALLRLAKAKMPEKVAELEGKQQERVDQKVKDFEESVGKEIAEAEKVLAKPGLGQNAMAPWKQKLDGAKARLKNLPQMRESFVNEIKRAIEQEIAVEAKKHYHEVLDAAAAEAGFTVTDLGPHARDLQRQPRFDKRYTPAEVYLWRSQNSLAEKDATDVLQDMVERRAYVAVCTKVEPIGIADLTRRDFESLRTGDGNRSFALQQAVGAWSRAFGREALEKRLVLQRPAGEQTAPPKVADEKKAADTKPDDKKPG